MLPEGFWLPGNWNPGLRLLCGEQSGGGGGGLLSSLPVSARPAERLQPGGLTAAPHACCIHTELRVCSASTVHVEGCTRIVAKCSLHNQQSRMELQAPLPQDFVQSSLVEESQACALTCRI